MNRWAGQPLPISATAWLDGDLGVRLSGSDAAVRAAAEKIGGSQTQAPPAEAFWRGIREQTDPYFSGPEPLWRAAVPSVHPPLDLPGRTLIEWGGGLRWIRSEASVRDAVQRAGGHATLFRARQKIIGAFMPLDPVLMRLHRDLKAAFDPAGILNPGRMYPEL
jgi:glycolate oxidase FAD binding subunit